MFKIPDLPSPEADITELSDFAEIECFKKGFISKQEMISKLGRIEENDIVSGNPIDSSTADRVDDVFGAIEERNKYCNGSYPFCIIAPGYLMKINEAVSEKSLSIYIFLLLATRFDMNRQKIKRDIDATLLFEHVSANVATCYLGDRAKQYVMGTSADAGSFETKVDALCQEMKEGGGYQNRNSSPMTQIKDDAVDIVVWKSFSDDFPGKLIAFGQCKTGTHWEQTLTSLQPDSFTRAWFKDQPVVPPIRMFFLADAVNRSEWSHKAIKAGVLFDRFRIMDFSKEIAGGNLDSIKTWLSQAKIDVASGN